MALFSFKARGKSGDVYEGTREAPDKFTLYRELKALGDTAIIIREVKRKAVRWRNFVPFMSRVGAHEKIIFARNTSAMLAAGLALSRALAVMERQAHNPRMKKILGVLNERVRAGKTLSDSLSVFPRVFPPLFVSMTKAGEESGTLSASLLTLADQMEKTYLLQKKVRGALLYPAIILTLMVTIGVLMLVYVVPTLTTTFKEFNLELPLSTRAVIAVSDFLKNNLFTAIMIIGVVILGTYAVSKTWRGKRMLDALSLGIPVVGELVREMNAARTARTFAALLSSGIDVVSATDIVGDVVQNSYFKEVLLAAGKNIEKGMPMSDVFSQDEHLYPAFLGEMVSVGEETGKLAPMLLEVGIFYENEVDQKTKDMSTIIEPVLMVGIGIVVGFFAIALMSPTYSLMNSL